MLENNTNAKQVIVIRTDLKNKNGQKLRTGKIAAQVAHASVASIFQLDQSINPQYFVIEKTPKLSWWFNHEFTKICLSVNSEEELIEIYNKAVDAGLNAVLITDAGHTEFDKPTMTCVGIGPDLSDKIDLVTGHLSLY